MPVNIRKQGNRITRKHGKPAPPAVKPIRTYTTTLHGQQNVRVKVYGLGVSLQVPLTVPRLKKRDQQGPREED